MPKVVGAPARRGAELAISVESLARCLLDRLDAGQPESGALALDLAQLRLDTGEVHGLGLQHGAQGGLGGAEVGVAPGRLALKV